MPRLRFSSYCGMSHEVEQGDDADVRLAAARLLRRRRRQGYPCTTLTIGMEWEVQEPDDCAMVPDACGILHVQDDPPPPEHRDWCRCEECCPEDDDA